MPKLAANHIPALRRVSIAALVMLAGCANPIVKLDVAGHSVQRSSTVTGEPKSVSEAIDKLNLVRATYYEAIRDQTGATQNAVSGLVWLGAVMLGASSHVHRDVLVTAGVVGGTTYGLTATQLDKRRIDVWVAGINALDCARLAIVPVEMSDEQRSLLQGKLTSLTARKTAVKAAAVNLAAHQGRAYVTAEAGEAIVALLAKADDALAQATKTENAGKAQMQSSLRGGELSATVNRISNKVTEVQGNLSLPVSAVMGILSALPTQINALVPGAIPPAPAPDPTAKAQSEDPAAKDTKALEQALADLAVEQAAVNGSLTNVDPTTVSAALQACNVADVIKPFELLPATWAFTQGRAESKGFEIKGGLGPYSVEPLGTLPDGVSYVFKGGKAKTVAITATDKAPPTEVRLLVSDSTNEPQSLQFIIKVNAPPATAPAAAPAAAPTRALAPTPAPKPPPAQAPPPSPAPPPATTPAPAPAPTPAPAPAAPAPGTPTDAAAIEAAWQSLDAALKAPGFSRALNGVTLSVDSTQLKAGRLFVKLKCSKPDAGLSATAVRDELAASAPEAKATLLKNNALNAKLQQIDLSRSKPCVKD